jgi:hypothetical protein
MKRENAMIDQLYEKQSGHTTPLRTFACIATIALLVLMTGCGGGSSFNEDSGVYIDDRGDKVITRTLDNQSEFRITVDLKVIGTYPLDTITIRPHDTATIVVEKLALDDWISYHAEFEGKDYTDGSFSEDGRTVFTHTDSRAVGAKAEEINGKAAVNAGAPVINLRIKRQPGTTAIEPPASLETLRHRGKSEEN